MTFRKIQGGLIPIVIVLLILFVSFIIISYGRGYRVDIGKKSIKPTGLIAGTSDPTGAQVFVNDKLITATNNSFNIEPGWYTVRIAKESFISWEKKLRVQGEIAVKTDAFLFPTNPSLSPLTTTGIEKPTLSPDGTKIAYIVPTNDTNQKKAGLWVLELSEGPLGRNRDPQQIGTGDELFNFSTSTLIWSPDSRQILVTSDTAARLFTIAKPLSFSDVSGSLQSTLSDWTTDRQSKEKQKLAGFPQPFIDIATSSAKILSFSPDEAKVLYEATASATLPNIIKPPLIGTNSTEEQRLLNSGKLYVYDAKEDKNFFVLDRKEFATKTSAQPTKKPTSINLDRSGTSSNGSRITDHEYPLQWFSTSRHLILAQNGKIDIMEYDRTNWITIYSGPFQESFIAPWGNGNRLVILTNLNPGASTLPNLYTVNLR